VQIHEIRFRDAHASETNHGIVLVTYYQLRVHPPLKQEVNHILVLDGFIELERQKGSFQKHLDGSISHPKPSIKVHDSTSPDGNSSTSCQVDSSFVCTTTSKILELVVS